MIEITMAAADAEAAIIGAMLIDPECIGDVMMAVSAGDFLTPRHGAIFEAIRGLFTHGKPVDPVTVVSTVGAECRETIYECLTITPTAANVLTYCETLREQARLYRLKIAAEAVAEADTLESAQERMSQALADAGEKPGMHVSSLSDLLSGFFQRMSAPEPPYLHWGLPMLDGSLFVTGGKYVLIGARPSTGKTALALQLGLTIAETQRVGFFSLETDGATAADRIAAQSMDANLPAIQRRKLSPTDMTVLSRQAARLAGRAKTFDFVTGSAMTVADIRSIALARRYEVVVIDYVQLIKATNPKLDRTQAMQTVSMELRAMAQLTGITVVALAQLRRPEPGAKPKAPTMADLKESGQFEQDADAVLLLYLEDAENRLSDRFLKIDKNKEGEAGIRCRLKFDGRKQRFAYVGPDGEAEAAPKFTPLHEQTAIPFEEG